ncbi:MAG: hypothetical protein GY845_05470, partial [Planctomycetes bacterium]|nr:hypothetical protein [Planctomycetota bacterium]
LFLNLFQRDIFTRITAGIAAGYLSMVFYAIFATTFDRGYWPFLSLSDQVKEVVSDGTGIAIAGSVLLLGAYALAAYLRPILLEIREFRPGIYYGGAGATAVSCWGFASIAFAAGL